MRTVGILPPASDFQYSFAQFTEVGNTVVPWIGWQEDAKAIVNGRYLWHQSAGMRVFATTGTTAV